MEVTSVLPYSSPRVNQNSFNNNNLQIQVELNWGEVLCFISFIRNFRKPFCFYMPINQVKIIEPVQQERRKHLSRNRVEERKVFSIPEDDIDTYAQFQEKFQMRKVELRNFSITFPGFIINLSITLTNSYEVGFCHTPIFTWLLVYEFLIFIYFTKSLVNIVLIKKIKDHNQMIRSKQIIDYAYYFLILSFQIMWLIYGNTFHYSQAAILCKEISDSNFRLWLQMMFFIVYGYGLIVFYTAYAIYYIKKNYIQLQKIIRQSTTKMINSRNRIEVQIPSQQDEELKQLSYVQKLGQNINHQSYDPQSSQESNLSPYLKPKKRVAFAVVVENPEVDDMCAICLVQFEDEDVIEELNCNHRHIFHPQCLRGWFEKKKQCPLCKMDVENSAIRFFKGNNNQEVINNAENMKQ